MIYALIGIAAGALGFAATAVALALRNGGLKSKLAKRRADNELLTVHNATLVEGLHKLRQEVQGTILARDREVAALRRRLTEMRTHLAKLPDTPVNRDAVLAELDRLLLPEDEADPSDPSS